MPYPWSINMQHKKIIFTGLAVIVCGISVALPPAKAIVPIETFPTATSFNQSMGTEVPVDLQGISFLNVIENRNNGKKQLIVADDSGKGAIVEKENDHYRTYQGLQWNKVPVAQVISDITGDNLKDIISLLPASQGDTKAWHYAKIIQVNSNSIQIDTPLRKNILAQSTIIAPNGKQYSVQNNNGPQEDSPPNTLFLAKEVGSGSTDPLPSYNMLFQTNQYIAYLLPLKKAIDLPRIEIHKNLGDNNFSALACTPYIPATIDKITSLVTQDINADQKMDLILLTHPREEFQSTNVQSTYNAEQKILTLTIQVPPAQIQSRNLIGSYFSFGSFPEQLYKIRGNTNNQIVIDIGLPNNGDGLSTLQTTLQSGDRFWITLNDEGSRKMLLYQGDGQGCFTYQGTQSGTVFETSYGQIKLPGAEQSTEASRTVITDTNASFLPIDSLANRKLTVAGHQYTIEHNDQGHLFLTAADGDLRQTIPDILHNQTPTQYQIDSLTPEPTVNLEQAEQIVNVYREIPLEIDRLIDSKPLATNQAWVRPIDIDSDSDIDLLFINQKKVFLKTNNERL